MSTTLNDVENVWGSGEDEIAVHQWTNLEKEFTNAGYREGITAGKESALQEGFNDGFDNIGAPLGREIGILRGAAGAALSLLSSTEPRLSSDPMNLEKRKEELRTIMQDLGQISLADLAARDMQAEVHIAQHSETDVPGEISHVTDNQEVDGSDAFQESLVRPAVEDLRRLRFQLSNALTQLGLNIALD